MAKTAKTKAKEATIKAAPDAKGPKTAGTKKAASRGTEPGAAKAEKKPKTAGTKKAASRGTEPGARPRSAKPKKRPRNEPLDDVGIIVVDDDLSIDQEKINEERRAYLEEARSQEAFD